MKKNSNKWISLLLLVAIILYSGTLFQIGKAVGATVPEPGTDGDPIVSKSYVDNLISGVNTKLSQISDTLKGLSGKDPEVELLNKKISELSERIDSMSKNPTVSPLETTDPSNPSTTTPNVTVNPSSTHKPSPTPKATSVPTQSTNFKFKTVVLKTGKKLIGKASTEIILRLGKATAIGSNKYGLIDIMTGSELKTGATIKINHLILVPVDDNRGITAKSNCTLIVRGDYVIK